MRMSVVSRMYVDAVDRGRVMGFLADSYRRHGFLANWLPPRFENNSREMDEHIRVWFDGERLVGLVVPEAP